VKQPDLVFFRVVEFGYGFGRRFGENLAVFTSNARIFSTASCSSSFGVCGERTIPVIEAFARKCGTREAFP